MEQVQSYPLTWPQGFPRVKARENGQFRTELHKALNNVEGSLRHPLPRRTASPPGWRNEMTIKIIRQPDLHMTASELARYRHEYEKAFAFYSGAPPDFEDWVRAQKEAHLDAGKKE